MGSRNGTPEKELKSWAEDQLGRRCIVVRPTVTFGADNFANMFTLIRQIDSGKFIFVGDGGNLKSLSFVNNIVDATARLVVLSETG